MNLSEYYEWHNSTRGKLVNASMLGSTSLALFELAPPETIYEITGTGFGLAAALKVASVIVGRLSPPN
jgi:hypothetical protein